MIYPKGSAEEGALPMMHDQAEERVARSAHPSGCCPGDEPQRGGT